MSLSAIAQIRFFRKVIFKHIGKQPNKCTTLHCIFNDVQYKVTILFWLLKAGY